MKLSIAVFAYNHEKYIEKAIRSVLAQNINFEYEVWINDDCSTDKTREIIEKIKPDLPNNFHIIYREKNIGANACVKDVYNNYLKGEYFATLEGDDYWINPEKLAIQIKFLDENPEYIAVAHNVKVIDKNGNDRTDYKYPECKKENYTLKDYKNGLYAGQTASLVCRNFYVNKMFIPFKCSVKWAGDSPKNFMLASFGKVKCFQECWSAYRYVTDSGDSYSANIVKNKDSETRLLIFRKELYEYALNEVKTKESISVAEALYLHCVLTAVLKKKVDNLKMKDYFRLLFKAKHKGSCVTYSIKSIFKKRTK